MLHTVSSIRDWRKCRRLYRYAHVDLVRPARDDTKRGLGKVVHSGLEAFVLGCSPMAVMLTTIDGLDEVEAARARAMLAGYCARWESAREDWEPVKVEATFDMPPPGAPAGAARLGGKPDAIMRYRPTGELFVWEHKTTSEEIADVGSDYWQRLAVDLQLTVYQHNVAVETGESPRLLYDVLRKPGGGPKLKEAIRRRKTESDEEYESRKLAARETVEEFEARLTADLRAEPDAYYVRREVHRMREQNDSMLAELRETIDEIESYRGSYPRNDGACQGRYGRCAYLSVCAGIEQLDSERFVRLESAHPELSIPMDDYADCPL